MPISSGATGHVGIGVDQSIKWIPDGYGTDTQHSPRNCDSYLQRYLETHPDARKRYITKDVMVLTQSSFSDKMENGTADENMQKRSVSIDIKGDDKKELQHQKKNRSGQDNIKKTTGKSKKKMTETGNKKTTEKTQSKTSSNNSSTCTLL
ncbi:hypothetical protein AOXY_G2131 [Acipenser oxyrinchus oxyrinchus]|uniref:Uncharacterized protein n=1 Tax=Acipenser oxyrinchus oxyrinchus TaxID=40147 RepID=A0AAD8GHX6_ACIOX|nr:hypothetical protein AOXY_G2131 [Acipenser oxyrinchus oxyrinchus]